MEKEILLNDRKIKYKLYFKKVKNINLRIKADGEICVSANKTVNIEMIERFITSKSGYILKHLDEYNKQSEVPMNKSFTEEELIKIVLEASENIFPYFQKYGIQYPVIKFRKMKSRWGSCIPSKGKITINLNLVYADRTCVEYVVIHEFTHLIQPDHSKKFYLEIGKIMPDYKSAELKLKQINLYNIQKRLSKN